MFKTIIGVAALAATLGACGAASTLNETSSGDATPNPIAAPFEDPARDLLEAKGQVRAHLPIPAPEAAPAPVAQAPAKPAPKAAQTAPKAKAPTKAQCDNTGAGRLNQSDWMAYCYKAKTAKPLPANVPPMDWDGCRPPSSGPPEIACR